MTSGRDILWSISMPFRIKNTRELNVNDFINILVFETFDVFNIEIAKKLITLAKEKGFIEIVDDSIKFLLPNLWNPIVYKLDWVPDFSEIGDVKEFETHSLPYLPELKFSPRKSKIKDLVKMETANFKGKKIIKNKAKTKKEDEIKEKTEKKSKKVKRSLKRIKKSKKRIKKVKPKKIKSLEDFF
ncbi:MAG: DUF2240 family protein [Promethearchaeota archaeon]